MSCIAALRRADNHLAADSAPTRRHRPMVHPEHHSPPSFSLFSHSQRWWSLISDEAARQQTTSCIPASALRRTHYHLAADSVSARRHRLTVHQ